MNKYQYETQLTLFDNELYVEYERIEVARADGQVECEGCGKRYHDHESDYRYPKLGRSAIQLCDGTLVKL